MQNPAAGFISVYQSSESRVIHETNGLYASRIRHIDRERSSSPETTRINANLDLVHLESIQQQ